MNKKEIIDHLLSKIPDDRKETFVAELREAKTKEDRLEVLKKYNVAFTQEELQAFRKKDGNEVSDAELDDAAGGCNCFCQCSGCV